MQWIKLDKDSITRDLMDQLLQLEANCGLEPFSLEMLNMCVHELDTYAWIDNGQIAGFITIQAAPVKSGGGIYIANLNVGIPYRRQNLGTSLMLTALSEYAYSHQGKTVSLDVLKRNHAALGLYQKLGFMLTDLPSENGPDDYVMLARLDRLLGTVVTRRLSLRPIIPEHTSKLSDILRNDLVKATYMLPDLEPDAARELAMRIISLSIDRKRYVRGIYRGEQLIGFVNDVEILDGCIELGWVISPSEQNKGYATEAVAAVTKDLFAKGYQRVIAGAFSENKASIRVMEKAGMHPIQKTEQIDYRGTIQHCVFFEATPE